MKHTFFCVLMLDDADSLSMKAVSCLAYFLTTKTKKKPMTIEHCNLDVSFLLKEAPVKVFLS